RGPWVKHLSADSPYARLKLTDKAAYLDFIVEIIQRSDDQRLPGPASSLGGRAHLRLDGPMATSRPRLRAADRRLPRHDPRRHGRHLAQAKCPPMNSKTDSQVGHELFQLDGDSHCHNYSAIDCHVY